MHSIYNALIISNILTYMSNSGNASILQSKQEYPCSFKIIFLAINRHDRHAVRTEFHFTRKTLGSQEQIVVKIVFERTHGVIVISGINQTYLEVTVMFTDQCATIIQL